MDFLIIIGMIVAIIVLKHAVSKQQQRILLSVIVAGYIMFTVFAGIMVIFNSKDIIWHGMFVTVGSILCLISVRYCKNPTLFYIIVYVFILAIICISEKILRIWWINDDDSNSEAKFYGFA